MKPKLPDARGHFGRFGGRFVPETLMAPLIELERAWSAAKRDRRFQQRLAGLLRDYAGRPTPLYHAARLSEQCGGARIYLKREDLCHTGAHKINNVLGQALLAARMKKRRVIAETGAGQHGVATATAAALLGLECDVYMGAEDVERQALNVFRMRLLGARVISVESGSKTLKDAINEALRDWVTNVQTTYYLLGSALGPHPYPVMVRDLHAVIGQEARRQSRRVLRRLPDVLVACVGGGSNAIGLFHAFVGDRRVRIIGVEPGGEGIATGRHGASMSAGAVGVLHGCMSYLLQSDDGQIATAHSISAGLDYPGVGPEHAYYRDAGRFEFVSITDAEALEGFEALTRLEGIMPALESAHAVAYAMRLAKTLPRSKAIVVGLSGRGDKDVHVVAKALGEGDRMTSRLDATFARLRERGERALVPYFTAGDPSLADTRRLVLEAARRGADVIELGVPFSDPLADGPVIQRAAMRALAAGTTLPRLLETVAALRAEVSVPLVLLTYYNPVLAFGLEAFARAAVRAGVDGVIVVDLPPEEADPLAREAEAAGLDLIHMVAPTSTPERVRLIARRSRGFIYLVSLRGVTGERQELPPDLAAQIRALRRVTSKPVCVGFGVSTPEQVAAVGRLADGAAVGSAIVRLVEERAGSLSLVNDVGAFIAELKAPLRAGLDLAGRKGA